MPPETGDLTGQTREPAVLVLRTSPIKRYISAGILYALAGLLGLVLFLHPPEELVWLLFLAGMVAATIWLAVRTQAATADWLELRADGLYVNGQTCLCRLDEIASVSRGAFAFKPSNGFLLRLKSSGTRHWAPGLFWRLGPFLGVGGTTSKAQADVMSEAIALAVERQSSSS